MVFCTKCEKSCELSTATGELIFKCPICQTQVKASDYDVMMSSNYSAVEETVDLWDNIIRNAPFDRVSEKVAKTCKKCNRDYMTRLRLGKSEIIVYSCKCGYNSVSETVSETKEQKERKVEKEIGGDLASAIESTPEIKEIKAEPSNNGGKSSSQLPTGIKFLTINDYKFPNSRKDVRIAAFDFDYTLMKPYGSEFPKNSDDFILVRKSIPQAMEKFAQDHLVVVFSNQTKRSEMAVERIEKAIKHYKLPVNYVFVATDKKHAKPETIMFDEMLRFFKIESVDKAHSFYTGDDYNKSDSAFSKAIGLPFKNPLDLFPLTNEIPIKVSPDKLHVVMTVGFPASGKSYIAQKEFPGFNQVSIDISGSRPKALAAMESLLKEKKNVIFDATNPSKADRKSIIDIAKKYNGDVYIIYMNMTISEAKKKNKIRDRTVPEVVYSVYAKNFEIPTSDEGQIIIYDF